MAPCLLADHCFITVGDGDRDLYFGCRYSQSDEALLFGSYATTLDFECSTPWLIFAATMLMSQAGLHIQPASVVKAGDIIDALLPRPEPHMTLNIIAGLRDLRWGKRASGRISGRYSATTAYRGYGNN